MFMASQQPPDSFPRLIVQGDAPLIGVCVSAQDASVVMYVADEDAAEQAISDDMVRNALLLAGAWDDLSWDEIEAGLTRIRRESQPTPLFEV
jgi:hypothetical protein